MPQDQNNTPNSCWCNNNNNLLHYHKGLSAIGLSLPTGSLGLLPFHFLYCILNVFSTVQSHREEYPIRNRRERGGVTGGGWRLFVFSMESVAGFFVCVRVLHISRLVHCWWFWSIQRLLLASSLFVSGHICPDGKFGQAHGMLLLPQFPWPQDRDQAL